MSYLDSKYDYGYDYSEKRDVCNRSCGEYKQVAYAPEIKVVCKVDDLVLRTVKTSISTKFEILDNGSLINRYPTLRVAETFFVDFAGITKAKYKKLCAA